MVLINNNYTQIVYGVYGDGRIIILNALNMNMLDNNIKSIYAPSCLLLQSLMGLPVIKSKTDNHTS